MDEKTLTLMYSEPFQVKKGCLLREVNDDHAKRLEKLCNFAPYITREITQDDGLETTTRIALRGLHESGKELPEIEIDAADLAAFNWLPERWGMDCIHPADFFPKIRNLGIDFCRRLEYVVRTDGR